MESSLESVNNHEEVPVRVGDVRRLSKVDVLLLLLIETLIFSTIIRISIVNIGVASVVESLEGCSNSSKSLIEFLWRWNG